LQSVAGESDRSRGRGGRKTQIAGRGTRPHSWFSLAVANADRAARSGFVLSMMFLAASGVYGFVLSGALTPIASELAAAVDGAAFDAGFRLEDLAVSGSRNTPKAALMDALQLPFSGSSLFYDAAAARDRLLQLGWIEDAEVSRILPTRLEAVLVERSPFARWANAAAKVYVIDRAGHVLGPAGPDGFATLPLFAGEGAPIEAAAFQDALAGREAIGGRIARAELVAERFWLVRLDNGLMLKLPRKVNGLVLDRLESLLANPRILEMGLETIDLRLSNRTILQLREPTMANRDKAILLLMAGPGQGQSAIPAKKGKAL
jgi:cell division protein FtsQ